LTEEAQYFQLRGFTAPRRFILSVDLLQLAGWRLQEFDFRCAWKIAVRKITNDLRPRLGSAARRVVRNEQHYFLLRLDKEKTVKSDQIPFMSDPPQVIAPVLVEAHTECGQLVAGAELWRPHSRQGFGLQYRLAIQTAAIQK